ncbi:MAG: outer membrane lipoprotein-sorting protein [Opitutaceae bacterium]|jgi:hypothetical protein
MAPGTGWRIRFLACLLAASRLTAGPPSAVQAPGLAQVGLPDQAQGRAILSQFRESGPARPCYVEFELRQLPRRGPERTFRGRMWSERNPQGNVMRIELNPGEAGERRFLVQNGESAAVWFFDPKEMAAMPRRMDPLSPLVPGIETTPFDIQMPYLYWPDETLQSIARVPGLQRPAYVFIFRPPSDFAAGAAGLAGVRAYLDTEYNAPVRTEIFASDGRILKTLSLVDLKKVQGRYMPKEFDVRNEATRDKTRFELTAAAIDVAVRPSVFEPAELSSPLEPPTAGIDRFGP